jgi:CHAD domain-containing protein
VTRSDVVAFAGNEHDPATAIARLERMGFEFDPCSTVIRTLLDTVDGRLHRAGLRLEVRECDGLQLILTGEGTPAHLAVASVPRFPDELPLGPFRSRLAATVDVRALLPVVRVTATCSPGHRRNRAGKLVATVAIYEHVRIDDLDVARWTIEIGDLAGYARQASKAEDALVQLGLARLEGDTMTNAADAAGVRLAGASGSTNAPLDPMMPAIVGFGAVLAELAETIVANWQGTVERIDPEFLHELRVAVRRTRTVIAEGKRVLPPAIVERAEARFGRLGTLTGPARDLDVHLISWAIDTKPLASDVVSALEPVHFLLELRREAAHATLARVLASREATGLMTAAETWWCAPALAKCPGVDAERPLGGIVTKRIARAHANLVKRGRLILPDTPAEQVHDLRKAAKRLRYLLECFASLLDDAPRKAFVRRLKTFQDNLGEHHDAAIRVEALRAISHELHVRGASPETMLAIGQLIAQVDQRRSATRFEFAEHFAAYDTKATQRDLDAALAGANG